MSEQKLSDVQKRALLRGEVQKLRATGMDYDESFRTAAAAHPEWRPVGETRAAGQRSPRRSGTIANGGDGGRDQQIQRLVAMYVREHPGTSYDAGFSAVLRDPANRQLAESLHRPGRAPVNMWGKR
jgi:hypothetical protein